MADASAPAPIEEFKVPALPPPKPGGALPADIEQIIASGAHIDEFPPIDSTGQPTSNYEQVVRDLKAKAGFALGPAEGEPAKAQQVEDGLEGIEKEMEKEGIVREAVPLGGDMEGVEGEVKAEADDE